MPAFIRTKSDESHWEKAKQAANKTHSEADGDRYWGLVNHIYQSIKKNDDLKKAYDDEEDDELDDDNCNSSNLKTKESI